MTVRVQYKPGALRAIRTSPGALSEVESRAKRVKNAAESDGGKYKVRAAIGASRPQGRARASVTTDNFKAMRKNAKHNSLLKALDAGR